MRIVFIGTGEIGVPVLRWLIASENHQLVGVVTQPDKPVGRDQRIQAPPIKAAAGTSSVPVLQPERIKRPEAVAAIAALQPDIIVVMAYGQILPRAVLKIPRLACLNLHASLLPKYRGAAPIQAAIVAGDSETGITVMYMDEGLDTGDILLQSRLPILPDETGGSLHDRLGAIAPTAFATALAQLESGTAPRVPQKSAEATYAPKLEREHGRINWSETAEVIVRKIRAFNPWPAAFTILTDSSGTLRKLKIFSASRVQANVGAPGAITASDDGMIISAGDGGISPEEVQLEGKRRMSAREFARGVNVTALSASAPQT